jgi:hypothetical protein
MCFYCQYTRCAVLDICLDFRCIVLAVTGRLRKFGIYSNYIQYSVHFACRLNDSEYFEY